MTEPDEMVVFNGGILFAAGELSGKISQFFSFVFVARVWYLLCWHSNKPKILRASKDKVDQLKDGEYEWIVTLNGIGFRENLFGQENDGI